MNTWEIGILLCTVVEYCQILGRLVLKGFYFMLSCPSMVLNQGGQMFGEFNLRHIKSPFCNWEHRGSKCYIWVKNFARWLLDLGISNLQLQLLKSVILRCNNANMYLLLLALTHLSFYYILRDIIESIMEGNSSLSLTPNISLIKQVS